MGQQGQQVGVAVVALQHHRGAEAAQQRRHGRLRDAHKGEGVRRLVQHQRALVALGRVLACQLQGQGAAISCHQAQRDGDDEGQFLALAGRGRAALRQRELVGLRASVVVAHGLHARRASLAVPALEGVQVLGQRAGGVGVGHGLGEVVAGHGAAIVALEIQLHALGKAFFAHQVVLHTHHFRTFFINGEGVEVVDFYVAVRAHGVGHGAGVFRELCGAQHAHVFNALDGARRGAARHVLAEFLVAEHRQALFERELEPVAAGDAVARPVMEVFVPHHAFNVGEIGVGGGGFAGQNVLGVEDVQALVFHGAHVEVAGGNDHEAF